LHHRPASSKEAIHDAPEVVEAWPSPPPHHRPSSPFSGQFSEDGTVISGFQPIEFDHKGDPIPSRRESEQPEEKKRICGLTRGYFLGLVILLAIGLGVGLGVGLNQKKSA
jgi:hypothetical protein